jgi:hypothetical protein
LAQISQTAACNRFHEAEARLSPWLRMTRDRVATRAWNSASRGTSLSTMRSTAEPSLLFAAAQTGRMHSHTIAIVAPDRVIGRNGGRIEGLSPDAFFVSRKRRCVPAAPRRDGRYTTAGGTQAVPILATTQHSLETTMTHEILDRNRIADPKPAPTSGALGTHPVGTGLGAVAGAAAGGAAAGALAGTAAGPVGTVVGAVAGAVAGGLAGKGIAEMIDPTAEEAYWRENFSSRPYVAQGATYDYYGPAYRYGVDAYGRYEGQSFEKAEPELVRGWQRAKGTSSLTWANAKHATRDAWQRISDAVERAVPGDSDRDGK